MHIGNVCKGLYKLFFHKVDLRANQAQSETLKIPFTISADGKVEVSEEGLPWWYIAGGVGAVILIAGAVWVVRRKKT